MAKMAGLAAMGVTNLRDYILGRMDERDDFLQVLEKELENANATADTQRAEFVTDMIHLVKVRQFQDVE